MIYCEFELFPTSFVGEILGICERYSSRELRARQEGLEMQQRDSIGTRR